LEKSKLIFEAAMKIRDEYDFIVYLNNILKKRVTKIPALRLLGESSSSVVAWTTSKFDIYKLGDAMGKRGWNLNMIQNPNGYLILILE
jgi:glutamate/tyrosine decarboxylase-like PLP-dependent enzyme